MKEVFRWILSHSFRIKERSLALFFIIIALGTLIYVFLFNKGWIESIFNAISLFTINVHIDKIDTVSREFLHLGTLCPLFEPIIKFVAENNKEIIYALAIVASIYTVLALIKIFSKKLSNELTLDINKKHEDYILVCGLGKKGTHFIDSLISSPKNNNNIIVIEKDLNNINIEKYREKNIGIVIGDATNIDVLKNVNIRKAKNIVLLAGEDVNNLEIALSIQNAVKKNELIQNIYIHIDDRSLFKFYREGGLLSNTKKLPVKVFSMAQNSAKSLFLKHYIDGNSRVYIDSSKSFSIVIIGNTILALEVIKQACEIAHFPNENHMTIYCMDKHVEKLQEEVSVFYKHIQNIPNITLKYKSLDWNTSKFYEDIVWQEDITNIILCDENAQNNLDIASQLLDDTYIKEAHLGTLQCKIHIAVYENTEIAQNLHENKSKYIDCDTFALTKEMASAKHVLEEEYDNIAKAIHAGYGEEYNPYVQHSLDYMNEKWLNNAKLPDRESNYAQVYHLPLKLKALGLKMEKAPKNENNIEHIRVKFEKMAQSLQQDLEKLGQTENCLIDNTKYFYSNNRLFEILKTLKWSNQPAILTLRDYQYHYNEANGKRKFDYFPIEYETLFEKLIRSEHNRWNAHHYLKGWRFSEVTNKSMKKHACLLPLSKFPDDLKYTVLYDMYSILYIPNYLAQAQKTVEPYPKGELIFGVIGHRNLSRDTIKKLKEKLYKELDILLERNRFTKIISPLAEGADTLVAEVMTNNDKYNADLIVPLPMPKEEYLKYFSNEENKEAFDMHVKKPFKNEKVYIVENLTSDNDLKFCNTGKEVVNQCDVLITLWDEKKAKDADRIDDVVAYAKKKRKAILHINTDTFKVEKINFDGIIIV